MIAQADTVKPLVRPLRVAQGEACPADGQNTESDHKSLSKTDRSLLETQNEGGVGKILLAKSPPHDRINRQTGPNGKSRLKTTLVPFPKK